MVRRLCTSTQVEDFTRFIDQVQNEDVVLCESVQRGLRSGYFEQGKLMLSRENGLRHFQQLVYRTLAALRRVYGGGHGFPG